MLDLKTFEYRNSRNDIIAKKWHGWGFVYAFIEVFLGIDFLLRINPLLVDGVAFAVMAVSITWVLKAVLNKQKIQCACLGTVFNLLMSNAIIIEDALMIAMSGFLICK